jgi:hypothetical protein
LTGSLERLIYFYFRQTYAFATFLVSLNRQTDESGLLFYFVPFLELMRHYQVRSSIDNPSIRVLDDNDLVEIKYTLQGQKGELYHVSVYGSHDNFSKPLISVTGDVGSGIEVGGGKTILWQPKTELVSFTGNISFEIKAELSAAPITNPTTLKSIYRRGKTFDFSWNGGAKQEVFQVQLLKGGLRKRDIDTVTIQNIYNNKLYWRISGDLRKGYDYQIKIASADRSNVQEQSAAFTIKPRFPLVIKCLPLAAGLVAGVLILSSGSSGEPSQLPEPPAAPTR